MERKEITLLGNNRKLFAEICNKHYGRKIIYSNADSITADNVVKELSKALSIHWRNREEIEYLDNYYRGDQPIGYKVKPNRPEINNKIVENHAFEIVEHKTAEMFGEPVQYVLNGNEENLSNEIKTLNTMMNHDDKSECDTELGRWRSICGTSYRFIWIDNEKEYLDETPFGFECCDPKNTFVVYSSKSGHKPLFSVQITKNEDNQTEYFIYTPSKTFAISNSKIVRSGANGIGYIPVIEYPNNSRRLSDIEIAITILDSINTIQSNRLDGIEQFVQAFILYVNCEIDEDKFLELCKVGVMSVKTINTSAPADVRSLSNQLDQEQTQVAKDDLYNNMLIIEGMPDRQENSGGDTGQAVVLRNGFYFSEKRAEINEPIFKKSERQFLRVVLKICETKQKLNLKLSDIEIKVTRSKMDNMQVKAQVLQMLLACGIDYDRAIKTVNLWSDPEQVCIESKPTLEAKYGVDAIKAQNQPKGGGSDGTD